MNIKKLLKKAVSGDREALNELRQAIPSGATVFVPDGDGLDIAATIEAIGYSKLHGHAPAEWGEDEQGREILTVDIDAAFPERQRLNPLTLQPITPGLWTRLWESENGHERVAALVWGRAKGEIRDGDAQIRLDIRALLKGGEYPLLQECVVLMNQNATEKTQAMDAVYPAVRRPATQRPATQRPAPVVEPSPAYVSPVERGQRAALADLEAEYNQGAIDIGRYLKLKASLGGGDDYSAYIDPGDGYNPRRYRRSEQLRDAVARGFDLEGLKTLAFDLGYDVENFSSTAKSGIARELIQQTLRDCREAQFLSAIRRANPAAWRWYING